MMTVERIGQGFERWDELLSLILAAFASMDGVIDPPSSANRLTPDGLRQKARDEIGYLAWDQARMLGCIFCRPEPGHLYVGKLAVHPDAQSRGIGRTLLTAVEKEAERLGLPGLRLDTRIELVGNHRTFAHWGFQKTAERSHPGFDRVTYIEMTKVLTPAD